MKSEYKEAEIKPYNLVQLSSLYKVSTGLMRTWILRYKIELDYEPGRSRLFTQRQVYILFQKLGHPKVKEGAKGS